MGNQKPKTIGINSIFNLGIKNLTILIFVLILYKNDINVAIIDRDVNYIICKLKMTYIFDVFIINLEF